jgi:hypothetical protein
LLRRSRRSSSRRLRLLELLRAVWGAACLVAPLRLTTAAGGPSDDRTLAATRLLGVRHLVQALVSVLRPSRRVLVVGGLVDLSHSASMALLGGLDPGRRRLAWVDGVVEAGWGAASLSDGRAAIPRPWLEG